VIAEPSVVATPLGGATPRSALLSVEGLHVAYGAIAALRGVTLSIRDGEVVALLGANGAGKSTLLRTLSGLVRPTAGTARFDGLDLARASSSAIVRRGLVHVPEGREILGRLTVRENLALGAWPRRPGSPGGTPGAVRPQRRALAADVDRVLVRFPLLARRADTPAGALSGGEGQILAIARALMARPRLLLLDEPSLGLSPRLADEVFDLVAGIAAGGVTVLLVEQNAAIALDLAERAYVIESGRIEKEGSAASLRHDPDVRAAYLGPERPTARRPGGYQRRGSE
jgi:branched-chain amino acid transport system ATP-binding protein